MKKISLELIVGLFIVFGTASILYLSVAVSGLSIFEADGYHLKAKFENSSGLKKGAVVEIAGVKIGQVESINLDTDTQESLVWIKVQTNVEIQDDAVASIRTAGIIGDKFIKISTGGGDPLEDGDEIIETEPSISIEELISKYMFSNES
ncbi:MAG: outer membrane lipid asymmetry maintenance protein MlaD [Enterobacterales bacterium]|nr:outer membrane lipid asymmetry maintenance protein MlaD [Enterobacterales bacterium]